ncbi:type VII secretion protein EccE [Nocardia sp. NPDC055029]
MRDPEFWLFRHLPLHLVIPLGLGAALAAWIALAADLRLWAVLAIGAAVFALGAVPVRRRYPRNLAGMLARVAAYRWRRVRPGPGHLGAEPFDVPLPEGGSYSVRADGDLLVTMLRIDPPPDSATLLRRGALSTEQVLPLAEIAKCLDQFDIALSSIDIISTGARTAGTGTLAALYNQIIGPLPAIAHRTVWLVLRMDPLANTDAVANRGGGAEGALRTAIIATRRVANRLAAHDISASVLTATEMNSAVRLLTRNIALDEFTETPTGLAHDGIHLTSYEIGPELVGTQGFADIWATPSMSTTVTVRLRPGAHRPATAGVGPESITVGALVRFDTVSAPAEPPVAGLRPMPGRQFRALLDTLPVPSSSRDTTSDYRGALGALDGIVVPTAGCGQLIGADDHGQGLAVPLIGDGTRHLEVIGRLGLAQQVILRALALGARAVVHTTRPDAWQAMVGNVDAPHLLSLAPRSAGATQHLPPTAPPTDALFPATTVVVFDGLPPAALTGGATVVHVRSPHEPGDAPTADVVLIQDQDRPTLITVRTASDTWTVNMVTTPDEMRYIGESLAAAR